MDMRTNDKTENRYRSRSQLCMSSSGPRSMRGGEVRKRAPRSAACARDRIAPATSSSRSELFGASAMGMRANDRAEH